MAQPRRAITENGADLLHALTLVPAHTSRVTLGTSIPVVFYPVLIPQSRTTMDCLWVRRLGTGLSRGQGSKMACSLKAPSQVGQSLL